MSFCLDFCIFQGSKCPLRPIFPMRLILIATLLQHLQTLVSPVCRDKRLASNGLRYSPSRSKRAGPGKASEHEKHSTARKAWRPRSIPLARCTFCWLAFRKVSLLLRHVGSFLSSKFYELISKDRKNQSNRKEDFTSKPDRFIDQDI